MPELSLISIIIGGIAGCLAMDIWQRLLFFSTGTPPSNWAMVGRWFFYSVRSLTLFHPDIEDKPALSYELRLGWLVHHAVGCGYALIYVIAIHWNLLGLTFADGVIFGALSVVVPWFFFLPAMGKGILARLTPQPVKICILAFATHILFGIGIVFGLSLAL